MEEKKKLQLFYHFLRKQSSRKEYEELVNELGKSNAPENFDDIFNSCFDQFQKKEKNQYSATDLSEEVAKLIEAAKRKEQFNKSFNSTFFPPVFLRIAAAVVFIVGISIFWHYTIDHRLLSFIDKKVMLEKSTKYGEESEFLLSDGSKLKLNAGSLVHFEKTFSGTTREVSLNGEAFFDVAKNKHKPFVIKTGKLQVTVLGTAFDVKSYEDDDYATVTVTRGRVKVNSPEREYIITPNEQICFNKSTGELVKRNVDAADYIKWTTGTLCFRKTQVKEMIRQLERQYDVKIKVNNPTILSRTVTGEYSKLSTILEALEFTLNVKSDVKNQVITFN